MAVGEGNELGPRNKGDLKYPYDQATLAQIAELGFRERRARECARILAGEFEEGEPIPLPINRTLGNFPTSMKRVIRGKVTSKGMTAEKSPTPYSTADFMGMVLEGRIIRLKFVGDPNTVTHEEPVHSATVYIISMMAEGQQGVYPENLDCGVVLTHENEDDPAVGQCEMFTYTPPGGTAAYGDAERLMETAHIDTILASGRFAGL
jgi:hypothetical protein